MKERYLGPCRRGAEASAYLAGLAPLEEAAGSSTLEWGPSAAAEGVVEARTLLGGQEAETPEEGEEGHS